MMSPSRLAIPALALAGLLRAGAQGPAEPADRVDWWQANQDLHRQLQEPGARLAELAGRASASQPRTPADAMRRVAVLLRAGMEEAAIAAVRDLRRLCPDLGSHQVESLYYEACDRAAAWEFARVTLEEFAANLREAALDNRLLRHWEAAGWPPEKIDAWLAARPPGLDGCWVKERLRFNARYGRAEGLLREMTDAVKAAPDDVARAALLLDALAGARTSETNLVDLSWFPATVRTARATDADRIAGGLRNLGCWPEALAFGTRAMETPLTDAEAEDLGRMCQAFIPPELLRAMFEANVRENLAECLLQLGRAAEAQRRMVEAQDIRAKHGLGLSALFAGQVQAASGERVIEGRIRAEEQKSELDPLYWRERAEYYRGRNEAAQEEDAIRRGLALTAPAAPPERPGKGHADMRRWLLSDLAHFLGRHDRAAEAVELLRGEIRSVPPGAESAEGAARMLAFDFEKHVQPDDEVLWTWLAGRPEWSHTEERLLWRMLQAAEAAGALEAGFARAEALARDAAASRARALGWIMNRMRHPARSVPLLQYAEQRAKDDDVRRSAAFALFESYLDLGDWRRAEETFPRACRQLTAREVPEWLARVALAAARDGAKADAMRLWAAASNLEPRRLNDLGAMAKAGLGDELRAFYREMAAKMPGSDIPRRALELLGSR